ncbi:MAG: transcriptional regulator [Nitrospirota bacterium]
MKRTKMKQPPVPPERRETIRQQIMGALEGRTLSAQELSGEVAVSEKDIYEHLEHIQRSSIRGGNTLRTMPAVCKKCGFVFRKRDKLSKPGKCPVCKSSFIEPPLFSLQWGKKE